MTDDLFGPPALEPEYAQEYADLFGAPAAPVRTTNPRLLFDAQQQSLEMAQPCPQGTLTEELGALVDELRQLQTDFGQRPYRVFSVIYAWSGGEEGIGTLSIVSEREFLPRPVVDIRGTKNTMTSAGQRDEGTAVLREVSPQMTEDQIRSFAPTLLPAGQYGFIEVRMDERDGTQVIRRRYVVRDVPTRNAAKFDWEVPLVTQESARSRNGTLSAPALYPTRIAEEA